MAAQQTRLDFRWRDESDKSIIDRPKPLENQAAGGQPQVKCYRNVIFTWLFHTPLLLNWIDDRHGPENHGREECVLCRLRGLAKTFWSKSRSRRLQAEKFDLAVDNFWTDIGSFATLDLNQQNDAEEYMKSLIECLRILEPDWAQLVSTLKLCVRICQRCSLDTKEWDGDIVLKGTLSRENIKYQPLCQILHFSSIENDRCERCDASMPHRNLYSLLNTPPILIIHIPAAIADDNYTYLDRKVARLEHIMAFSSYTDASLDPRTIRWAFYQLYGVIMHFGPNVSAGHYACAFEQRKSGQWLWFDDLGEGTAEKLTKETLDQKVKKLQREDWRVFMLMYRKLFEMSIYPPPIEPQTQHAQPESDDWETGHSPAGDSAPAEEVENDQLVELFDETDNQPHGSVHSKTGQQPIAAEEDQSQGSAHPVPEKQPIPAEQTTQVEATGPRQTRSRTKAAEEALHKTEDEQTEPSAPTTKQAKPAQTRSRAKKRALDVAETEVERTTSSVPASKKARTGAKSSGGKEKSSTATKRAREKAQDENEGEPTTSSAPPKRRAGTKEKSAQPEGTEKKRKTRRKE